jgi:hypothetical protein
MQLHLFNGLQQQQHQQQQFFCVVKSFSFWDVIGDHFQVLLVTHVKSFLAF